MLKELKNNLRVELAQSADIQFVHEILKRNFPQDLLRFTFYQYDSYVDYLKKRLAYDLILLLKSDNKICGFAHFLKYTNNTLFLNNIYIEEEFRGLNGGGLLINEGEKWGRKLRLDKFQLDVFETNTNATLFYKKKFFKKDFIINWYVFTSDYKSYTPCEINLSEHFLFVKIKLSDNIKDIPVFNNCFYRITNINLLKNKELMQIVKKNNAYFFYVGNDSIPGIKPISRTIRMTKKIIFLK